jgi:uncharacterized protein
MWLAGNAGPFELIELKVSVGLRAPLSVLHISDLHFAPGQAKKAGFLKEISETEPDLIINTGDNLGHQNAIGPALKALEALLGIPGVFVNGSNDYRAPKPRNWLKYLKGPSQIESPRDLDTARFTTELENAGWLNLNNRSGNLEINGQALGFLGFDDPHENLDKPETLNKQVTDTKDAEFVFGVAHAPYMRVIENFTAAGAGLLFAGHTHGGQICLPGKRALITNCDLPTQYAQGLSAWEHEGKHSMLHVSGGLGCSIYAPVRLFCPPAATLLTIT